MLHLHPDMGIVSPLDQDLQAKKLNKACLINVLAASMSIC
jgi:hypothetical protein